MRLYNHIIAAAVAAIAFSPAAKAAIELPDIVGNNMEIGRAHV